MIHAPGPYKGPQRRNPPLVDAKKFLEDLQKQS